MMENNQFLIEANKDSLKYLTNQFNSFSVSNYSENANNDLKVFFGRLLHQIQKLETNLDDKLYNYVKNIKEENPNASKIKFPILEKKNETKQASLYDLFPTSFDKKPDDFEKDFLRQNSSIKSKKTKPFTQERKRFDLKKRRVNKIYQPQQILSKDARNDPFIDLPPLSENQMRRGLQSLIGNGVIPKDLDLAPAFEKNPPLNSYLIKLKEKPLQFKKKANFSQIINDDTLNLHLDAKTFITEKPQSIEEPSYKNISKLGTSFKQKELQPKDIAWEKLKLEVKRGKFVENSQEFQFFRKYNQSNWNSLLQVLKKIEVFLGENEIKYADIKADCVISLISTKKKIQKSQLASCILNHDLIKSSMFLATKKFKGPKAEDLAIRYIQKILRELIIIKKKKRDCLRLKMAKTIQVNYRIFKLYQKTKEKIKNNFIEFSDEYDEILKKFKKEWVDIKGIERVEIHLNSFAYTETQRLTMENFLQRANTQISRIFSCKDPLVEIIYITPIEIDEEIINYYSKVLQIGELVNFKEKVHFIFPEGSNYLPYNFSTSMKLLFSPCALKQIKKIIGLKPAYIITGYPGENDLKLAKILKIPCFCGNPVKASVFNKKVGSRELFLKCNLPIPPSSSRFTNEEEFINELVLLIYRNPNINTWLFKINNEFGGRGIASFTVDTLRLLNGLKSKNNYNQNSNTTHSNVDTKDFSDELEEFYSIIKNLVPIKTVMACQFLYRNYREFLDELFKQGGIIEGTPPNIRPEHACPTSVLLYIEPSGEYQINATYDRVTGPEYRNIGFLMPTRNTNLFNLSLICNPIVKNLLNADVFGFITIDFIVFPDPQIKSSYPLFWMIGLDCYLNDFGSLLYYFEFLIKGKADPKSGRFFIEIANKNTNLNNNTNNLATNHMPENNFLDSHEEESKNKIFTEKYMIYCPYIIHPGLSEFEYKDFFHKCRLEMILFDLEKKTGASFLLIDTLKNHFLSILGIGDDWRNAVKHMTDTLNFLIQNVGSSQNQKYEKKKKDIRHDSIPLSEIINKIRILNKNLEKEMEKNQTGRKSIF